MASPCILRAAEVSLFLSFAAMLVTFIARSWMDVSFDLPRDPWSRSYYTDRLTQTYGLWYMESCLISYRYEEGDEECRQVSYHEIREDIWMYNSNIYSYKNKFHICFTSNYETIRNWQIQVTFALAIVMLCFYLTRKQRIRNADMLAGKSNVSPSNAWCKFIAFWCLVQDVLMVIQIVWFAQRNNAAAAFYEKDVDVETPWCLVFAVIAVALSVMAFFFLLVIINESPPTQSRVSKQQQQQPFVALQLAEQAPAGHGPDPV